MRIIYDWRLARVIDEDLNILDEAVWTASRTSSKVANRLGDLQRGRMTQEARVLSERFPNAQLDPFGHLESNDWPEMTHEDDQMVATAANIATGLEMSEQAIRALATNYLPTLSRLVGPLGAAKLCVLAGGRERLARMPSGSIQVLGAHAAMAAHRRGAPPPKHGSVIFSMPQVSRSPRWVRGKIARYLAGKASIASRIDHFDGTPWSDNEIADIHKKSEEIRSRFSSPPRKK